ncbi:hypothetical protein DLAC_11625 [Tieghemostelium lacteum]|uniref:Uncharacterized protein n=1 Tax=Tieghemostelium lacteum TaxID=361077 RepID=A0A151ZFS8_TIELA|nr:hypothetical protein DLAC_11625 [Tieghemostelium lacteum]|eukprot:KYQ92832.1 hypothetical protein DLAC_11625 [Tieghemostelium lacteum]
MQFNNNHQNNINIVPYPHQQLPKPEFIVPITKSSQSPTPPIYKNNVNNNNENSSTILSNIEGIYCYNRSCVLCSRGTPSALNNYPTWSAIMKVVLFTLHFSNPEKRYFSLKYDIYNFIKIHWDLLSLSKKKSTNWRKQIQDMLSHSKNIFSSGANIVGQSGYWGLNNICDPWAVNITRFKIIDATAFTSNTTASAYLQSLKLLPDHFIVPNSNSRINGEVCAPSFQFHHLDPTSTFNEISKPSTTTTSYSKDKKPKINKQDLVEISNIDTDEKLKCIKIDFLISK